jgi:integrase
MKDIKAIKAMLQNKPRDLCLFTVGINTNLRASDLLQITAGDVRGKKPGDAIVLREKKTGKVRKITLNKSCVVAIKCLLGACRGINPKALNSFTFNILFLLYIL